jgi:hypothetical protein
MEAFLGIVETKVNGALALNDGTGANTRWHSRDRKAQANAD